MELQQDKIIFAMAPRQTGYDFGVKRANSYFPGKSYF